MMPSIPAQSKGILNPKTAHEKFQLSRHFPSPDLTYFIERYWIIHWDLRGQAPYVQEILPYPCVNMAIQEGHSGIFGVITGKSSHHLEGQGRVFGIKFRPGAFYPFLKSPVSELTNTICSIWEVFGADGLALEAAVLAVERKQDMIALAEAFLRARLPEQDENIDLVNQIIDCIIEDRTITRVDDLVKRINLSKRTVQRLFHRYVGVSPKWVIQRYRLQEAAAQLDDGNIADWPRLALELGYFDQAHFIKDFKAIVGQSPGEYARSKEAI